MELVLHPDSAGTFKKNFVEPGRNAPCYCGSGRKYKNCCLDKNYAVIRTKCEAASKKNMGATLPPESPRPPAYKPEMSDGAAQGVLSHIRKGLRLFRQKKP